MVVMMAKQEAKKQRIEYNYMFCKNFGIHCNDSDIDYLLGNSVWELRLFRQILRRNIIPLTVLIVGGVGVL